MSSRGDVRGHFAVGSRRADRESAAWWSDPIMRCLCVYRRWPMAQSSVCIANVVALLSLSILYSFDRSLCAKLPSVASLCGSHTSPTCVRCISSLACHAAASERSIRVVTPAIQARCSHAGVRRNTSQVDGGGKGLRRHIHGQRLGATQQMHSAQSAIGNLPHAALRAPR